MKKNKKNLLNQTYEYYPSASIDKMQKMLDRVSYWTKYHFSRSNNAGQIDLTLSVTHNIFL